MPMEERRRPLAGDKKRVHDRMPHATLGLGCVDTSDAGSAAVFGVLLAVV